LGKGLGGGLAISACLGSEKVMDAWKRNPGVVHTSTFQANPLACATGTATIDFIRLKKLDERAKRVGNAFQSWLRTSLEPFPAIKAITGAGLMVGITFDSGATVNHIIPKLLHHGYIAISGGMDGECLTLTPSLTIEEDLLEAFVDTLAKILAS
jgi:acetylornithine/succinyldiaminopimelate/putrescine aminotransferase